MKIGKMKILITESENFSGKAIANLQSNFEVEIANIKSKKELLEIISDFDVIFVRLALKIDKEIIEKAKKLK